MNSVSAVAAHDSECHGSLNALLSVLSMMNCLQFLAKSPPFTRPVSLLASSPAIPFIIPLGSGYASRAGKINHISRQVSESRTGNKSCASWQEVTNKQQTPPEAATESLIQFIAHAVQLCHNIDYVALTRCNSVLLL